jgi:hypothetical protein
MQSKDIFVAVYWPETQELLEDPEFLNNAVLINDAELYDEYGSSSYMVRAEWLMKKQHSYEKGLLDVTNQMLEDAIISQMEEEAIRNDMADFC